MLSQINLASLPNLRNFHRNTVTLECDLEKQRTSAQSCNIGSIGWLPITSHSRFEKLGELGSSPWWMAWKYKNIRVSAGPIVILSDWSMLKLTYPLWRILSTDGDGMLFLQPSYNRPHELCRFRIKTSKQFFPRLLEDLDVRPVYVRALSV
jgi:hypothetical protein